MSIQPKPEHRANGPTMSALPHSLEDERALLNSLLLSPNTVAPIVGRLSITTWYGTTGERNLSPHAIVVTTVLQMLAAGIAVDLLTVTRALREANQLDGIGGPAFLTGLFDDYSSPANAEYYADALRHKARLREIHETAAAVAAAALLDGADPAHLSERMQQLLTGLARDASTGRDVVPMKDLTMDAIARLEARYEGRGKLRGIASGLARLDRLTNGWQGGQMIVVAAPEKQGKSSLARQFVLEAALHGVGVAIFSHEMGREEIVDALIATQARVDGRRIEDGTLADMDLPKITAAASKLTDLPIFIFDEADSSVLQFRANARRAVRDYGCGLIVLDYLQLVAGSEGTENREERVSEVGRNVKLAAKELGIPIIVLSQLNKDGVTQYARAIQQHLDRLIVIEHEDPEAEGDGKAWVKVKLARGGPKGSVPVMWRPSITRFDALAEETTTSRVGEIG